MIVLTWEARAKRGVSLARLSRMSGIGKATLWRIENGITSPTLWQLERIAIALDMRMTDLFQSDYK